MLEKLNPKREIEREIRVYIMLAVGTVFVLHATIESLAVCAQHLR